MNVSGIHQLMLLTTLAHGVLYLVMLAVVIIGWRRTRHTGFLVLVAWSVLTLAALLSRPLWVPVMSPLVAKVFGTSIDAGNLSLVITLVSGIATSALLCLGLAMLVFARPRPQ